MDTENDRDQIVTRIVLPSGKTIEVLRLSERGARSADAGGPMPGHTAGPPGRPSDVAPEAEPSGAAIVGPGCPNVCPGCDSTLVYPVAWGAAGGERWRVELRCPNCERTESALLDLDVAEHFDEQLERGAETLMSDLARLTEANMLEDLERFAAALRADAILPGDF